MLKSEQIANAQFTLIGKGAYRAEEVDAFLNNVAASYQDSLKQNDELMRKIGILAERIEQYREEEDSIKSALINAERMAKTIRKEAEDEKAATVKSAQDEASTIIENARQSAKDFVAKTKVTIAAYLEKANKEAAAIVNAANAQAEEKVAAAEAQSAEIIGNSEEKLAFFTKKSNALQEQIAAYKAAMNDACRSGLAALDTLPEDKDFEIDEEALLAEIKAAAAAPAVDADADIAEEETSEEDFKEVADVSDEDEIFENILAEVTANAAENAEAVEEPEAPAEEPAEEEEEPAEADEEDEEEELFVDLFSDTGAADDEADATFTPDAPDAEDEEDAAFEGFKINLEDIDDGDGEENGSIFSGFFD